MMSFQGSMLWTTSQSRTHPLAIRVYLGLPAYWQSHSVVFLSTLLHCCHGLELCRWTLSAYNFLYRFSSVLLGGLSGILHIVCISNSLYTLHGLTHVDHIYSRMFAQVLWSLTMSSASQCQITILNTEMEAIGMHE